MCCTFCTCCGRYCSGYDTNIVGSVSSTLLTVLTLLMWACLGGAICAFRTKSLEKGIPEGVYVALGGRGGLSYEVLLAFQYPNC